MPAQRPDDIPGLVADAFNTSGLEALLALYEPDAVLVVPPGGERVSGIDNIRRKAGPMFAEISGARIELVGKVTSGELAMTHADWTLTESDGEGGEVEMTGRGTVVSRQQPDGNWLIVFDNPLSA